jgi:predicted anti-sigma-YlaC factor YlaD
MRCSTSERLFDCLLDGTLSALQRRRLDSHLDSCRRCTSVLEELRVIDALLLTPRTLEPAPNFTHKTMAEIRSMPPPKPHKPRLPVWGWLGIYLALSWTVIGVWIAYGRPDAHSALMLSLGFLGHVSTAFGDIGRAASLRIGSLGATIVGLVLGVDLLLISLAFIAPRVVARLAQGEAA